MQHHLRMLCALAFVPMDDVADAFAVLKRSMQQKALEIAGIFDYFEETYIGKLNPRTCKRASADFPIKVWNMYDCARENKARTNNSVEGWHHAVGFSINCDHPDVYHLINFLRTEEDRVRTHLVRNDTRYKRKKYATIDKRIHDTVMDYSNLMGDVLHYLSILSYSVHL